MSFLGDGHPTKYPSEMKGSERAQSSTGSKGEAGPWSAGITVGVAFHSDHSIQCISSEPLTKVYRQGHKTDTD